jgi:hypothetical protein
VAVPTVLELLERLLAFWAAHGGTVRPGNPPERLTAFEARYGVRLPADLRAYFAACDGAEYPEQDPDGYRSLIEFYALGDVRQIAERAGRPPGLAPRELNGAAPGAYFVVADYSIDAAIYSIWLTADPRAPAPVVIGPHTPEDDGHLLAPSFAEFLRLYLDNPRALPSG